MTAVPTMWAAELAGPSTLVSCTTPAPTAADLQQGEVLLRSLAGGICGSDIPYFRGKRDPSGAAGESPRVGYPLHEIVGEVMASKDAQTKVGSRVVGWATALNGLAEFVVTRGTSVQASAFEPMVAIMLQPLACVLYAVDQLGPLDDRSVAILGVGPIGALFAHVLASRGASRVVGVDRVDRRDIQSCFRLDEVVRSDAKSWAVAVSDNERPDIVIEAVGHQVETMNNAVQALGWEGTIFYFGIPSDRAYPFPLEQFLRKNARLISGYTPESHRRRLLANAEDYLGHYPKLIDGFLGANYPWTDAQAAFEAAAFEAAASKAAGRMKVTLTLGA